MIKDCTGNEDFSEILEDSNRKPVFLLKHSTACPHSAWALERFSEFSKNNKEADFWKVLVIENRSLSRKIAEDTCIEHASPQGFLFYKGKVMWTGYRDEINKDCMTEALKSIS
ncbi:MAG: bacillithiol system redox-active protein YtxJ [Candidatus Eremiobacterota bacterium]